MTWVEELELVPLHLTTSPLHKNIGSGYKTADLNSEFKFTEIVCPLINLFNFQALRCDTFRRVALKKRRHLL